MFDTLNYKKEVIHKTIVRYTKEIICLVVQNICNKSICISCLCILLKNLIDVNY